MRTHDVAIVGAGPAGSSLAIELCRRGFDVLLLERGRFPRDKVCGDFLSPRAIQLLGALDCCIDALLTELAPQPLRSTEVLLDGETLSEGTIPDVDGVAGVGYAIARSDLDGLLFRCARASGAAIVEGCRVTGFEPHGPGVRIEAELDGVPRQFEARLIVGADGAQSIVARTAGLAAKDSRYTLSAMRGYLEGFPLDKSLLLFSSELFPGYGWVFPMGSGRANFGAGIIAEASTRDRLRIKDFVGQLRGLIEGRARALGAEVSFGPLAGWPIKTFRADAPRVFEHGLLIGEAGGFVDPINGEGIPLALETAALAAQAIGEALAAGDLSSKGLQLFEKSWRGRLEADLRIGDLLVSMVRNRHLRDVWLAWFRAINRRARTDPSYAREVGGVLAGAIPNRRLFRLDVMAKSLLHDWDLLRDFTAASSDGHAQLDPIRMLGGIGTRELERMKRLSLDANWVLRWADEVVEKQLGVLASLLRSSMAAGSARGVRMSGRERDHGRAQGAVRIRTS